MASLTVPTLSSNLAYSSSIAHFISLSKPTHPNRKSGPKLTCNATEGTQNSSDPDIASSKNGEASLLKLDRRNVLLGIGGGLYSASTFGSNPSAFAAPLAPTFTACHDSTDPDNKEIDCCPPSATAADITDFVPTAPSVIATRPAAQLVDSTYLNKYKKAIEAMKNLSSDDPRNFTAQANVHCAYCNGGYYQDGYADSKLLLDVHNSWLFFPFHRWYLYFFEKICQNLIDDDTFALPFWNWDQPSGMYLPAIFKDTSSPLYDKLRNSSHLTAVLDLSWDGTDSTASNTEVIRNNLYLMYKQMVTQATTPLSFLGKSFRAGDESDPGAGSIETSPHVNVHRWTGDPNESHGENMGAFYSAGRDPVFYCHHANVDRMWSLWNSLGGQNFTDSDWLNSSFYFYNEQAKPVRVYVKDCFDTSVLGYSYQTVDIPWLTCKPSARRTAITLPTAPSPSAVFPTSLEKVITVLVKRPKKNRTKKDKQKAEEVLEISGIQYNIGEFVQFDVYINEDTPDESGPEKTELLGSFINLPHGHSMTSTTSKSFAISEVLQELGADDFESILVTLVPKSSTVTISGVKIKYDSTKASA